MLRSRDRSTGNPAREFDNYLKIYQSRMILLSLSANPHGRALIPALAR